VSARRFAGAARRRSTRVWATLGVALLALAYANLTPAPDSTPGPATARDDGAIVRLYQEKRSGDVVEGVGTVERVLADDREGSRHQRFILRIGSGHTLLVSHNIDLARRIPGIAEGDEVLFRGQYEWNEQGGVLHWTHHDPAGRRQGGWLRYRGETYR
jgi:hypothetical protein